MEVKETMTVMSPTAEPIVIMYDRGDGIIDTLIIPSQ